MADLTLNLYILELRPGLSLDAITAALVMVLATGLAFAYFYLSEMITTDLSRIGDSFYDSPWHRVLSTRQQKMLVLPIQQSQRAYRLKGLGLFDGSLAVFSAVF